MDELDLKQAKLDAILQSYEGEVAHAFSCYDENAFLVAYAQKILNSRVFAIMADAEIFTKEDQILCQTSARAMNLELMSVSVRVMHELDFIVNDDKRCYYCRRYILGSMAKAVRSIGARHVMIGLTVDGLAGQLYVADILNEFDISAPFAEAGLTNKEVNALALKTGYEDDDGGRCMAERIPTGVPLDGQMLQFLADAEALLRSHGLKRARVEIIDEGRAKIVLPKKIKKIELDEDATNEIRAFLQARKYEIEGWPK